MTDWSKFRGSRFSRILFFVLICCIVSFVVAHGANSAPIPPARTPLSLVFLLDSSGSMKENDPKGLRKAAAQAVISLLSPDDDVAVVEFAEDGRVVAEDSAKPWVKAGDRDRALGLVQKVSDKGLFTDFRAGLKSALEVMGTAPEGRRRVVLMLSDGLLDPNPLDKAYTPHQDEYRIDIFKAGRDGRRAVNEAYRTRLSPIARRIISEEIVPKLKERQAEVFTVGLSPQADREFLDRIAESTTRNPLEQHSFHAGKATDLLGTFTRLLQYWTNSTVLHVAEGEILPGASKQVFLDEFVRDPWVFTMFDGEGEVSIKTEGGVAETPVAQGAQGVNAVPLKGALPGTWNFGFQKGQGRYKAVWVGKNNLSMNVEGLKKSYTFQEKVDAVVGLSASTPQGQTPYTTPGTKVYADIYPEKGGGSPTRHELKPDGNGYRLSVPPQGVGRYVVGFTACPKDRQGKDLLPRPSPGYRVEVLPSFGVSPDRIDFGTSKGGKELSKSVEVRSGLGKEVEVSVAGSVLQSSSKAFRKNDAARMPSVVATKFRVSAGETRNESIRLLLPNDADWGDFEGEIVFKADTGDQARVEFSIHVPSLWEKVRWVLLCVFLLAALVLGYFVYIWGFLGSPSGVLIPLTWPPGEITRNIQLSKERRGLLSRYFNWNRNVIRIANRDTEILLRKLPDGFVVELAFTRWKNVVYLRNKSRTGGEIKVRDGRGGVIGRKPGSSLGIKTGCVIEMEGYSFKYENR